MPSKKEKTTMGSNAAGIKRGIKAAEKDLTKLQKDRRKYSGRELKDIDQQIKTLKETITIYRRML